jgi:hypothetical protein
MRRASRISDGRIVTRRACVAHKLVSYRQSKRQRGNMKPLKKETVTSNSLKTNDSPASCRASIAWALKLRLACENTSQRAASVLQSDASCLKVLRHLTNHPAIRRLGNEELRRLLVPPDLPQGDRARAPPAGFLEATRCGSTLASGLRRLDDNSPLRRLTASGPACSLLGPAYAPALV